MEIIIIAPTITESLPMGMVSSIFGIEADHIKGCFNCKDVLLDDGVVQENGTVICQRCAWNNLSEELSRSCKVSREKEKSLLDIAVPLVEAAKDAIGNIQTIFEQMNQDEKFVREVGEPIYIEYLFMFTHIALRSASSKVSTAGLTIVENVLISRYASQTFDGYRLASPNAKYAEYSKSLSDFWITRNREYRHCPIIFNQKHIYDLESVIGLLVNNVLNYLQSTDIQKSAKVIANAAYTRLDNQNLNNCFAKAASIYAM